MTALPSTGELRDLARRSLDACGVDGALVGGDRTSRTPVTGGDLLPVSWASPGDVDRAVAVAQEAFEQWRTTPAPVRGVLVKRLGELLAEHKEPLADLVTLEVGKCGVCAGRDDGGSCVNPPSSRSP
jgi:aldehyde dehydrogenase (NAD+)